ncbi:uncharacterized protein BDV14DRAFT_197226 [Aspergillus stella-maris]|uniref:uncharacterized protein n=1 Tax=Aspergillus stella-maris TaxID=1810926 RepID=UPI003CCD7A8F
MASSILISRAEFDRTIRPLSGNANILAGVGYGFNTPITIYNVGQMQALLDEISSLKLADPWAQYLNPETIRHYSVVHWIIRHSVAELASSSPPTSLSMRNYAVKK